MLPRALADTSGVPRPTSASGSDVVGVRPKALWYEGTGWLGSTPPEPVLWWMKPVESAPCPIVVPFRKYLFQTVPTRAAAPLASLGRLVSPPATSCQIVAGSSAIANATRLCKVASIAAELSVLSEVPPTITPKRLAL